MDQKPDEEILVVDDDPFTRKMLVQNLSSAGYQCREAQNGREAWNQVHARHPALVLLDLDMPGLDGAELLRRIAGQPESRDRADPYNHADRRWQRRKRSVVPGSGR